MGCGEDSMTAHLCLDWCDEPSIPPLPPVEEPACTPAFVAQEQAQFLMQIQQAYTQQLMAADDVYPNDALAQYETVLSPAGWAGCAPPLVCVDCAGFETQPPCLPHHEEYTTEAHTCHLHEEYLSAGQSNSDTFRCLDGTCILQAGRCNGAQNCADGSDEAGCDAQANHFVPAYLSQSATCPDDFHDDVHFRCTSGQCIEKVGLCNGIHNCADGSDEAQCSAGIHVTVEATGGRTITVETLQTHTGVFHDRDYSFNSLGHFQGKTFIKYSNDDKMTDHLHVMTKLRTLEPLTVYIVKLDNHGLPWLELEGYTASSIEGVSFSGVRSTRHKEWDEDLLTTDHFAASAVHKKTFPAGTISIPGNNGGDGSFLIFLDHPSPEDRPCTGPEPPAPALEPPAPAPEPPAPAPAPAPTPEPVCRPDCSLPAGTSGHSLITKLDATVGAHNIYSQMTIGGSLSSGAPNQNLAVDGAVVTGGGSISGRWNFNGGQQTGVPLDEEWWQQFENIARYAEEAPSVDGGISMGVSRQEFLWMRSGGSSSRTLHDTPRRRAQCTLSDTVAFTTCMTLFLEGREKTMVDTSLSSTQLKPSFWTRPLMAGSSVPVCWLLWLRSA